VILRVEAADPLQRGRPMKVAATVGWVIVLVAAVVMLTRASTVVYSADSWSYVDLARSLFEPDRGLGEIFSTRDYVNEPWRNDSFPFLWPVILIPGIATWGAESPVGAVIFVAVWLLTSVIMMLTARHLQLPPFLAPALALSLLAIPEYVQEGHAGRSIPLNVLLMTASLYLLLRHGGNPWVALLLGVLLGLCAANRFDSLLYGPIVIILALVFGYLTWKGAIAAVCGWVVAPLAWVAYSLAQLGGIYVTDNGRVGLSPVPTHVTDWPAAVTQAEPGVIALMSKMLGNLDVLATSLVLTYQPWVKAGVVALIVGIALVRVWRSSVAEAVMRWFPREVIVDTRRWPYFLTSLTLALMALQAGLMLTTGYGDLRYWATSNVLLLELGAALSVAMGSAAASRQDFGRRLAVVGLTSLLVILAALGLRQVGREYRQTADQAASDARAIACITGVQGVPIVSGNGNEAFRIPATTDLRAAYAPLNAADLSAEHWADLAAEYGITAWINLSGDPANAMPVNATGILLEVACSKR
jgi:hypothetical protein